MRVKFKFLRIEERNGRPYAVMQYGNDERLLDTYELQHLLDNQREGGDDPDTYKRSIVVATDIIRKAQRALSTAQDGGKNSLLNPGNYP